MVQFWMIWDNPKTAFFMDKANGVSGPGCGDSGAQKECLGTVWEPRGTKADGWSKAVGMLYFMENLIKMDDDW